MDQWNGENAIEYTKKIFSNIEAIAQHMGYKENSLESIKQNAFNDIKHTLLKKAFNKSFKQWNGENAVEYTTNCLSDLKSIAQHMGYKENPWENIDHNTLNFTKSLILYNAISNSSYQWNEENAVEYAINCFNDLKSIAQHIGYEKGKLDNMGHRMLEGMKTTILYRAAYKSWVQFKGENTKEYAINSFNTIEDIANLIGNKDDQLESINHHVIYSTKSEIIKRVAEESWRREGKGKTFEERRQITQDIIQSTGHPIDLTTNNAIQQILKEKQDTMVADIEKWKKEGLPGRGWSNEDYENRKAENRLNASDRTMAHRFSNKANYQKMQELYKSYGARASLDIDTPNLTDSTYQRMHDYLSELEAAEKKLRKQSTKMLILDQYHIRKDHRDYNGILQGMRKSLIDPKLEKYNAALLKANKKYQRILAEEAKKADEHTSQ